MTPRFGRNRPHPARVERQPTFAKFRTTSPIVVPDDWDYGTLATAALQTMLANGPDPTVTIDPYAAANGLGCCTCAAPAHGVDVWTAGGDAPVIITADQTITLYCLSCGYVIGDPATDQGGDELTVLDYIATSGIDGNGLHKIAGSVAIDATNVTELREASFITGGVEFCAELPNAYTNPFPGPDAVWDVGTGPDYVPQQSQGHCFHGRGTYTSNGPNGQPAWGIVTWGTLVWYTTRAAAYYSTSAQGGSANSALSSEWVAKANGKAPNGLDAAGLTSALTAVAGSVTS
jgi:hypothetical protein